MSKPKKPTEVRVANREQLVQEYAAENPTPVPVERVQIGVRMEKRMVKVLKAIAEGSDTTLGELLEDIVMHALEGFTTFNDPQVLEDIKDFKRLYGMNYGVHEAYRFERDSNAG
jgi:hypothetical protein